MIHSSSRSSGSSRSLPVTRVPDKNGMVDDAFVQRMLTKGNVTLSDYNNSMEPAHQAHMANYLAGR